MPPSPVSLTLTYTTDLIVYEVSFYLAILFKNAFQASSSLGNIPKLYVNFMKTASNSGLKRRAETLAVVSLLFCLDEGFPSQSTFYRHKSELEPLALAWNEGPLSWLGRLRTAINTRNYAKYSSLTSRKRVLQECKKLNRLTILDDNRHVAQEAILTVIDSLRRRIGCLAWVTLKFAYRELTLSQEVDTSRWITRSLMLESVVSESDPGVDIWVKKKVEEGHLVARDGFTDRWIIKR